jgi:uncharacterized RDD family membrane protein YckC
MAAGWYEAPGDTPGTKRYWDGNQWTSGPMTDAEIAAQTGAAAPVSPVQPMAAEATALGAPGVGPWGVLAPWGTRAAAYLIDYGIALAGMLAIFVIALVFGAISEGLGLLIGTLGYISVFAATLYFHGWQQGDTGQSPGKRVMGIKIIRKDDGHVVGGGMGIARMFIHIVDGLVCYLGWLWPLWDTERQTWTDKIMSTHVIEVPKGEIMPIFPDGKPF